MLFILIKISYNFNYYLLKKVKRPRTPEKGRKEATEKKVTWNFENEFKKNEADYWRHLNKIRKDYKLYGLDENVDVREVELKNWIKNMDYDKIQENIDNGRIKRLNYTRTVQDD